MTVRAIATEADLDEALSEPTPPMIESLRRVPGDILVLGAGGKMGPSLVRLAVRATREGTPRRIIAVSRFSSPEAATSLDSIGATVFQCDLADRDAVALLPDAPNVIFMAGQKFGTTGTPSATWTANAIVPAICAERFRSARIVAFSTGNVYPLTPATRGGAREDNALAPVGEYAWSCLARERIFESFATRFGTRVAILRLNYAIALRYGVLTDLAVAIHHGSPIDLSMGFVNIIWQRDANTCALRMLEHASSPPAVFNVTGTATLPVRDLAIRLGLVLGREPVFAGQEAPDALLSNAQRMHDVLGPPDIDVDSMIEWTARWVASGERLLGKPTHFEARSGEF